MRAHAVMQSEAVIPAAGCTLHGPVILLLPQGQKASQIHSGQVEGNREREEEMDWS